MCRVYFYVVFESLSDIFSSFALTVASVIN